MAYNLILSPDDIFNPPLEKSEFNLKILKNILSEKGGKIDGDHMEFESMLGTVTVDIERDEKNGEVLIAFIILPLSLNEPTAMIALGGLCHDIAVSSKLRLFDPQKGIEITKKNLIYWGGNQMVSDDEIRLPSKNLMRAFAVILTLFLLLLILIWSITTKK